MRNTAHKQLNYNLIIETKLYINGKKTEKKLSSVKQSGLILTSNEIKNIRFLENRGVVLKGTTGKITSQERRFLNFLRL